MRAVIDTNIIIDLLNGIEQAKEELAKYEYPIISIITWIEVFTGVHDEAERSVIHSFFDKFRIEEVDSTIGWEATKIRQSSRKKLPDAIIEATAKVNETILVTRNTKDFDGNLPYIHVPYNLN